MQLQLFTQTFFRCLYTSLILLQEVDLRLALLSPCLAASGVNPLVAAHLSSVIVFAVNWVDELGFGYITMCQALFLVLCMY